MVKRHAYSYIRCSSLGQVKGDLFRARPRERKNFAEVGAGDLLGHGLFINT